jgi:hypothetical protein
MRKNAKEKHRKIPKVTKTWKQASRARDEQALSIGELLVGLKMEIDQKIDLLNSVETGSGEAGVPPGRKRLTYKEVKALLDRGEKI